MTATGDWPVWLVVAMCGIFSQGIKLLVYSVTRREVSLTAAFQGNGLPSLPANLLTCLLVMVVAREGWRSAEAAFALVFAVVVVHDTVKLGGLADRQRAALVRLLRATGSGHGRPRGVAAFLDPRAHHPAHVAVGALLGALFALAIVSVPH